MSLNQIEARAMFTDPVSRDRKVRRGIFDVPQLTSADSSRLLQDFAPMSIEGGKIRHGILYQPNHIEHPPDKLKLEESDKTMHFMSGLTLTGDIADLRSIKNSFRENPNHSFYAVEPGQSLHRAYNEMKLGQMNDAGGGRVNMVPVFLQTRHNEKPSPTHSAHDLMAVPGSGQHTRPIITHKPEAVKTTKKAMKHQLGDKRDMLRKKFGGR